MFIFSFSGKGDSRSGRMELRSRRVDNTRKGNDGRKGVIN